MASLESTFNTLPLYLQQKIDRAFYSSVGWKHQNDNRSGRRTPDAQVDPGGGFLFAEHTSQEDRFLEEDVSNPATIGFTTQDSVAIQIEEPAQIPLSSIPLALQCLDFPPDDEQVLSVFRNAASGWSSSNTANGISAGGEMVSRDDWRSVCAVLLEHHTEGYHESNIGMRQDESDDDDQKIYHCGSQYLESDTPSDSDDEYVEHQHASSPRRRSMKKSAPPSPSTSHKNALTPHQKQTCLEAFALFFPSIPFSELANQKIMIKDIQRVSKIIGEKIKSSEMLEMVEEFSNSPDKSMNLQDFSNMMVAAKLA